MAVCAAAPCRQAALIAGKPCAPLAALPRNAWFRPIQAAGRTHQRHPRRASRLSLAASGGAAAEGGAEAAPSLAEQRARAAAALVADTFLRDEITIGVGTGLGVNYLLEEIAQRLSSGKLRRVKCIPGSDVAASEAAFHGVPLTSLQEQPKVDLYVEVADEMVTDGTLAFILGRQQQPAQPQLHRARQLADAATTTVVIVPDPGLLVQRLGGSLPVALEEEGWEDSGEELDDIFLGDAELWRRSNIEGAGPRGGDSPYVSPEGHALIDIRFYEGLKLFGEDEDYGRIAAEIEGVPGVVAHGLMANVAAAAVVGQGPGEARLVWRGDAM